MLKIAIAGSTHYLLHTMSTMSNSQQHNAMLFVLVLTFSERQRGFFMPSGAGWS